MTIFGVKLRWESHQTSPPPPTPPVLRNGMYCKRRWGFVGLGGEGIGGAVYEQRKKRRKEEKKKILGERPCFHKKFYITNVCHEKKGEYVESVGMGKINHLCMYMYCMYMYIRACIYIPHLPTVLGSKREKFLLHISYYLSFFLNNLISNLNLSDEVHTCKACILYLHITELISLGSEVDEYYYSLTYV